MENKDFYKILEVSKNATHEDIKKAYRRLSLKYHPDKNTDKSAVGKFNEISSAYEILGDDEKRRVYDLSNRMPYFQEINVDLNPEEVMGLFQGLFDNRHPMHIFHNGSMPPSFSHFALHKPTPIIQNITINIAQAYSGVQIPVEINRTNIQNRIKTNETEVIYVDIPRGIDDGEIIVIREKGDIYDNMQGDIKLGIKIHNDTPWKRIGLDLVLEKTLTLKEALCGFSMEIQHINGQTMTLQNNKQGKTTIVHPGCKKVYPGLGIKRKEQNGNKEHSGNMIVLFHIEFPTILTAEQIEKITEIL
jgi:DnaJ-class molecular chaperone